MNNVYEILKERGYIKQITNEEKIQSVLSQKKVSFYIGFDPTADSLHVGHFLQLMVMAHMQKAGHLPIVLIGGGTAMVGDPTGKTDMRKMLSKEQINHNAEKFKQQISNFIDFKNKKAIMVNNADWLLSLNYINFLRDIGIHFSVNRMLGAECFKSRLEGKGLSFIEFNYMLMQSFDFLKLFKDYNCTVQLGGDDQWANIIGGVELVRRVESKEVFGMTFTLLTTGEGKKMGKTEGGSIWLDPEKTTPYDFYQYWRNVDDNDVEKCLLLLTFLPVEEIKKLCKEKNEKINYAKQVLAYEVTKLIHGEAEARKANEASKALFEGGANSDNIPSLKIEDKDIEQGLKLIDVLVEGGLAKSKSDARRTIQQNGISVNDKKVSDIEKIIKKEDFIDGSVLIRKGKKNYLKLKI